MKRAILTIFCLCLFLNAFSQSISLEPDGLQLPRFAANPACTVNDKGKQIYNTSLNKVFYCNGSSWVSSESGNNSSVNPAFSAYHPELINLRFDLPGIIFTAKNFDLSNNMKLDSELQDRNKFIAPIDGVYHFEFSAVLVFSNFIPNNQTVVRITIQKHGGGSEIVVIPIYANDNGKYISISKNFELKAGHGVWVSGTVLGVSSAGLFGILETKFDGFLVSRK